MERLKSAYEDEKEGIVPRRSLGSNYIDTDRKENGADAKDGKG